MGPGEGSNAVAQELECWCLSDVNRWSTNPPATQPHSSPAPPFPAPPCQPAVLHCSPPLYSPSLGLLLA
ncbi:hypothetical protein E2C01_088813 [Portunus trituberculatus]|uniref:Uncharacterized protein n=1 Tax=Portunus trituberculatus TaxID=210409 RepID=A0A5B7JGH1_PORTR|nr:hypothetical protein [Portunus trituberculatus]